LPLRHYYSPDAVKERHVATYGIAGAFMQSDTEGKVVMKLERVMAKVILKIDPKKTPNMLQKKVASMLSTSY
jgi:hypothetical protein